MSLRLFSRIAPATRSSLSSPYRSPSQLRSLTTTRRRCDILTELEEKLHPREVVERKKKLMEEKYAEKLRQKAEKEGLKDLEELKAKVLPKIDIKKEIVMDEKETERREVDPVQAKLLEEREKKLKEREAKIKAAEAEGQGADGQGIKPLSSIINLPLIHLTPHTTNDISKIWTAYHSAHPTLAASFLSASLPVPTYNAILSLAKENPFFVIPLPRLTEVLADDQVKNEGEVQTTEYEMFYLQWLFQPTPPSGPPSADPNPEPLLQTTSIIFTPLEEFKKAGEWAQPYLIMTHYPELAQSHDMVLMRGEISPASTSNPGSLSNPGFLLNQQQAQLMALALQRFYCAGIAPFGEDAKGKEQREQRMEALRGFRTRPGEWDWAGLVGMAYGDII